MALGARLSATTTKARTSDQFRFKLFANVGCPIEGFRKSILLNVTRAPEEQKRITLRNAAMALGGIQIGAGFSDEMAIEWLMAAFRYRCRLGRGQNTAAWA